MSKYEDYQLWRVYRYLKKFLTAQIWEEIDYSLVCVRLFPKEENEHHIRSQRKCLLYIDQCILKESKSKRNMITMAWIDCNKIYELGRYQGQ